MKYKKEAISRDSTGDYQHSLLPSFGEAVSTGELKRWQDEFNFVLVVSSMYSEIDEDSACFRRYEDGSGDFSLWSPEKRHDNFVLLSIHDTDNGPVAWWAAPVVENAFNRNGELILAT